MLGQKINEFDNSDGTIDSFNGIFPKTPLEGVGYVEIGDIVDSEKITESSPFVRCLTFYDKNFEMVGLDKHDFGYNNFFNNEDFLEASNVRFKYYAKALDGTIIATAYNFDSLAEKLNCNVNTLKKKINITVDENTNTKHKFNITRKEL